MTNFIPGDLVTSDKYGPGKVTRCNLTTPTIVLVSYKSGPYNCAYDGRTGHRCPRFGTDTITHEEADNAD